jgi:hypothetical protein
METPTKYPERGFLASTAGWVFCAFALIALFFLVAEHRAHLGFLVPYVPLALIGVCVLLHSYMHGLAHGRYPDDRPQGEDDRSGPDRHHHS